LLIPIYPAREKPIEGVTSEMILERITLDNARCVLKEEVLHELKMSNIEVLLTLGAGDIDRLVPEIKEYYA
jgi:UDP-N-acetylmuramate--alanine ligase